MGSFKAFINEAKILHLVGKFKKPGGAVHHVWQKDSAGYHYEVEHRATGHKFQHHDSLDALKEKGWNLAEETVDESEIGPIKKGAFHAWLGKSEDQPITAADIAKGKAAGGHAEKMATFAQNFAEETIDEAIKRGDTVKVRDASHHLYGKTGVVKTANSVESRNSGKVSHIITVDGGDHRVPTNAVGKVHEETDLIGEGELSEGHKLVDEKTGKEIKVGEKRKDFRGDMHKVMALHPPRHEASSGHVTTDKGHFYAGVVGGKYIKEETLDEAGEASKVKRALESQGVHGQTIGRNKDGTVTARRGFFYANGDAEGHKNRITDALTKAGVKHSVVDYGRHDAPFRGGASVKQGSHFHTTVKLHEETLDEVAEKDDTNLESHHHDALKHYAKENGRSWKSKLNTDWEKGTTHGEYTASLRQVRNRIGPSGLMKYKLHEETLDEARRIVSKHEYRERKAVVYRNPETGEHEVEFHSGGVHHKDATYFTNDKGDAQGTAKHWTSGAHSRTWPTDEHGNVKEETVTESNNNPNHDAAYIRKMEKVKRATRVYKNKQAKTE
jgi:hypothetical protein